MRLSHQSSVDAWVGAGLLHGEIAGISAGRSAEARPLRVSIDALRRSVGMPAGERYMLPRLLASLWLCVAAHSGSPASFAHSSSSGALLADRRWRCGAGISVDSPAARLLGVPTAFCGAVASRSSRAVPAAVCVLSVSCPLLSVS